MDKPKIKENQKTDGCISRDIRVRNGNGKAIIYLQKQQKTLAEVFISRAVSVKENKEFLVSIILEYIAYAKGERKSMEIRPSSIFDIQFKNGVAVIIDRRTAQTMATLSYNPNMPVLETMAFLYSIVQGYEKYYRLMNKHFCR